MLGAVSGIPDSFFDKKLRADIDALSPETESLRVIESLRRAWPAELARAGAELHALRQRARAKFGDDAPPYMTRKALEQATPPAVARFRALELEMRVPDARTIDGTCGLGSDARELARRGRAVVACDLDSFVLRCARANLEHAGLEAGFVRADAAEPPFRDVAGALWFVDPDRRTAQGGRIVDPERTSPPLSRVLELAAHFAGACVKLAPAVDADRLELPGHSRLCWVSTGRELCELGLWLGELCGEPGREAVVLRDDAVHRFSAKREEVEPLTGDEARSIAFLWEPDAAVIRSGLLGALAARLGVRPLAPEIAYLGSTEPPPESPFVETWPVLGVCSAHERNVRRLLAEHDVGPLTVKKRGHPEDAATLAKRFKGKGGRRGLLVVSRLADGHAAFLCGQRV